MCVVGGTWTPPSSGNNPVEDRGDVSSPSSLNDTMSMQDAPPQTPMFQILKQRRE